MSSSSMVSNVSPASALVLSIILFSSLVSNSISAFLFVLCCHSTILAGVMILLGSTEPKEEMTSVNNIEKMVESKKNTKWWNESQTNSSSITRKQSALLDLDEKTGVLTQNRTTYHPKITDVEKCYDTYSESSDFDHDNQESGGSEIDDHIQIREEDAFREEIDRLKEENKAQKEMLLEKDEAKREAIRQLSLSIDILKQENLYLKKRVAK